MKLTIEVYQSTFNDEWNCNIKTSEEPETTEYWAVENFCDLLSLIGDKFPKAKIISEQKE